LSLTNQSGSHDVAEDITEKSQSHQ
jgi:hypothetical protein